MASIFKQTKSQYWNIEFVFQGRRIRQSLKVTDKKVADAIRKEVEIKLALNQFKLEDLVKDITTTEYQKEHMQFVKTNKSLGTYKIYGDAWRHWLEFIGDIPIKSTGRKDVEAFKEKKLDEGLTPTTINMWLRSLRAAFNIAVDKKYLEANPFVKVTLLPTKKASAVLYLSQDDVKRFLDSIKDDQFKLLMEFFLYTGARLKEAHSLTWGDIDWNSGIIRFLNGTKHGKVRIVPLSGKIRPILERMRELAPRHRPEDRVFPYGYNYITKRVKAIFRKLGFAESLTLHKLLHTFASHLIMAGADLATVSMLLGHSSIRVTADYYAHLSPRHLKDTIDKLPF